jgi:hypothetical protein
MEAEQLKADLATFFGGAFKARSERSDYDARSVARVGQGREDGSVLLTLFPNPAMSYELFVTGVEAKDNYWLVTTSNKGRWTFSKLSPEILKEYKKQLREDGFSV